jgi:fused signal recognition particle receptor
MFGFGKKHRQGDPSETSPPSALAPSLPDVARLEPKGYDDSVVQREARDEDPISTSPTDQAAQAVGAEEQKRRGFWFRSRRHGAEVGEPSDHRNTPSVAAAPDPHGGEPERRSGVFSRLRDRLSRTRESLGEGIGTLVAGRKRIDDDLLEELETLLLTADVGVRATARIMDDLTQRVKRKSLADPRALLAALKEELRAILLAAQTPVRQPAPGRPQVVLMVGVNGAGKTTTIGKLAKRLQDEGNSVILAAGDTFRAAAVEQLQTWGERNRVSVVAQQTGADSASVIFDALQAATARQSDVLIADTAGRLHTKSNLMEELAKVARVMKKIDPDAPHEVMLVLDATTGQNALTQAVHFHQAVGITGITLTKLDGTAKGGILFAIVDRLKVPIRFIGVGEGIEDLRPFDADEFLDALLT